MTKQELQGKIEKSKETKTADSQKYKEALQLLESVRKDLLNKFSGLLKEELTPDVTELIKDTVCFNNIARSECLYFNKYNFGIQGTSINYSYGANEDHILHQPITREAYPTIGSISALSHILAKYQELYDTVKKCLPSLYDEISKSIASSSSSIELNRIFDTFGSEQKKKSEIDIERLCYNLYLCDRLRGISPDYLSSTTAAYFLRQSKGEVEESHNEWILERALKADSFSAFLIGDFRNEEYMERLLEAYNPRLLNAYHECLANYTDPQSEYDDYQRQ